MKTLIGAGAGFVAGLLGETFKFPLTQRLKRRQVRRALYKDLAQVRISLKASEEHYQHDHRLERTRLDAFDYIYNTERMAFYQLQECRVLSNLYDLIRRYTNEEDPNEAQHLLSKIILALRMAIQSGTLERALLDRFEKRITRPG